MENRLIYLDNNATTPTDPRVLEVMIPFFTEDFGNVASGHAFGRRARDRVDEARRQVASLINAKKAMNSNVLENQG